MKSDSGVSLSSLKVDGGASKNHLLMQFQSDLLNVPLHRPVVNETTALGAAFAAGLGVGLYKDLDDIKGSWKVDKSWTPNMTEEKRNNLVRSHSIVEFNRVILQTTHWSKAIERSLNWAE